LFATDIKIRTPEKSKSREDELVHLRGSFDFSGLAKARSASANPCLLDAEHPIRDGVRI
jgi:hypothetical protein